MVLSDNGASSEGGPDGSLNDARAWNVVRSTVEEADARLDEIGGPRVHNNYPWGWTVAGNTPFRRWKRETHEGGVADPLIVSWPDRIPAAADDPARGIRRQYVHAVDLAPTILDAIGITPPAALGGVQQQPIEGVSFAHTFGAEGAAALSRHITQYYEMFGCRALYHSGWKAVVYHPIQSDEPGLDAVTWELYDLRADPAECNNLASEQPQRVAAMVEQWWAAATRHQVLPLDNRPFSDLVLDRPSPVAHRDRYVYRPFRAPVPESVAANVKNRPHLITAYVTLGDSGAADGAPPDGVLAVQGSVLGGWSFHLLGDGRLCYVHNLSGWRSYRVEDQVGDLLTPGDHTLAFRFTPASADTGGVHRGELLVDGDVVGAGDIRRATWARFSITGAGLTVGWARDFSPADHDYRGEFRFTGDLDRVVVDLAGDEHVDAAAEAADAVRSQ